MGELLSGIGKVLIAALPFLRRGKAEREAGIDPVSAQDGRADDLLNGALGRLGALASDDSILKEIISGIAAVFVRPEHFSNPYVREWLSLANTKKSLKILAKAKLISAPDQKDIYEELIQSYIQMSGERRGLAEDCVNIAVAYLKASMQAAANDAGVAAIAQSGFESVHDRFNDVSRQLEGLSDGINNENKLSSADSQIAESLHGQMEAIRLLVDVSGEQSKALAGVEKAISRGLSGADSNIIDSEAMRRLEIISKSRFFIGFNLTENTQRMLTSIESGDLTRVSNSVKAEIYSWCARFLSATNCELAQVLLEKAASLGSGEVLDVARAFITAKNGNVPLALESLSLLETQLSRSAAFMIINNYENGRAALEWLRGAGLSIKDLNADGKVIAVQICLSCEDWDVALEYVEGLAESDFACAPALAYLAALVNLVQAVPLELRMVVMQPPPFEAAQFPLAGHHKAIAFRRKAQELYEKTVRYATELGLDKVANISADTALWLALRDLERSTLARAELEKSMRDTKDSLRRLPLALQFGLNIDLVAVEREIERKTTLSAGKSTDAAVARLALAFMQETPRKILEYINRHRDQLVERLDPKVIGFFEIEILVKTGQQKIARERIEELNFLGLTELERSRLLKMVEEAAGADPVEQNLALYEMSKSLTDLHSLVISLEEQGDWSRLAKYAGCLFYETHDLKDVTRYASALYHSGQLDKLLLLLGEFPAFLEQSERIEALRCWALYELGMFSEASKSLRQLRSKKDCEEYRQLVVSVAVSSGDWESLQTFVEDEWAARNDRSAEDLLRLAKLAGHLRSPRLKELVFEVARKGANDPRILIGCYSIATESGWEGIPEVFSWMQTAASLSSDEGPVQKISLQELLERQPRWETHESEVWRMLLGGMLPISVAASSLNRSFFSLFVTPALINEGESDVRKRSLVYAFSGSRRALQIEPKRIAMDVTSLLTVEMLGVTQKVFDAFNEVVIPHSLLGWLFEQKQRISFHQPSKVADAHEIRRYIADGSLKVFESTIVPSAELLMEVGEGLALMLSEVAASSADHDTQRIIVRPYPVHKVGSLVQEEADLEGYGDYLCSCTAIVEELARKGILTTAEADSCRAYLLLQEHPWPVALSISDSAHLFLDDVSVSYLQHLKLLAKLRRAGFTVLISAREVAEADSLIEYDNQASQVMALVESLRLQLRRGIESGKIRVGQSVREGQDSKSEGIKQNPFLDIFKLSTPIDTIVSDDRFLNQHAIVEVNGERKALLTSIDLLYVLLGRELISSNQFSEHVTRLRRFGMLFVPLELSELKKYLHESRVDGEILLESAELKAVRESVLRIAMSDALQLPQELPWINALCEVCVEAIRSQWYEGCDEKVARLKSNWILELLDIRKWSHAFKESHVEMLERYGAQVIALMLLPSNEPLVVRNMYWNWYEQRVLLHIKEDDSVLYSRVIMRAARIIELGLEDVPSLEGGEG